MTDPTTFPPFPNVLEDDQAAAASGGQPLDRSPGEGRSSQRGDDEEGASSATAQGDKSRLQQLREWVRQKQEQREIKMLEEVQQRYLAGDQSVLDTLPSDDAAALKVGSSSKPNLPRPEPPHVYKKKNRRDYNMWVRDCEAYHVQAPSEFRREDQRIAFGVQYISETLRTLWDTQCNEERVGNPTWQPTWEGLKQKMLDALGTPAERRQAAFDTLKAYKQRPNQTPTEVLAHLRPLWEELEDYNTQRQTHEYVSALMDSIKRDLFLLAASQRATIPQIEEQANVIYRRLPSFQKEAHPSSQKDSKKPQKKDKGNKNLRDSSDSEEDTRNSKRSRKDKDKDKDKSKTGSSQDKSQKSSGHQRNPMSNVTCYKCGKKGHIAPTCRSKPMEQSEDKSSEKLGPEKSSEKDKGRKT